MSCDFPLPYYVSEFPKGLSLVNFLGDEGQVYLEWIQAFPTKNTLYSVAYNLYFSTLHDDVFSEGVKVVSANLNGTLSDLTVMGDTMFFAVRAFQYDPSWYDLSELNNYQDSFKVYPETTLAENITVNELSIKLTSLIGFPSYGVVQIGAELIRYSSVTVDSLIVDERGFLGTIPTEHEVDGYDGEKIRSPFVKFFKGMEEQNFVIVSDENKFDYPNFAFTISDGYDIESVDLVTTDMTQSDESQVGRPFYDYAGWHRTDPAMIFDGSLLDSYIGGEQGCADDSSGVNRQVRGLPLNHFSHRREEILIGLTGRPCVLLRRKWTGIPCACKLPNQQNPQFRCPYCYGVGFVGGYDQVYNSRRSDGRIMVRFGPTDDDLSIDDGGLGVKEIPDCWTLVEPTVKDRDILVRFKEDMITESWRYEILKVTRNDLMFSLTGGQKFTTSRLDKTYPAYNFKINPDTGFFPANLTTSIGFVLGANNNLVPHTHNVVVSESIVALEQINFTTSTVLGHNHLIKNGIVHDSLDHTHTLNLT